MSLKELFSTVTVAKSLTNRTEESVGSDVESVRYHDADIVKEARFIPPVDYSKPESFARYGSAKKYYGDGVRNIYKTYPYDGSLYERIAWQNSSSYVDLYILENKYPRSTGYVNFSYGGWGSRNGSIVDGYGLPNDLEYISFYGGPNAKSTTPRTQGANIWAPANNRESNLEIDLTEGVSVEFWLKKDAFDAATSPKEVVFDLWNYANSSSVDYGRFRVDLTGSTAGTDPFKVTLMSGTVGFVTASVCASTFTAANVSDGAWHHYAFTFKSASAGITSRFYVDGDLNQENLLGSIGLNKISGSMMAYIGALRTPPSGTTTPSPVSAGAGKLSGSLDEFRYWKTQRSSKDIGRYWFTQVGGGTNTDLANTDLGVYYKFNEGITDVQSQNLTILDYSGRVSNGTWTREATYAAAIRNTGSAIVSSSAAATEFRDPIIYSNHPEVQATLTTLETTGSVYDYTNNSSLFNMFPSWMQEEDTKSGDDLSNLAQIIGTYFDSLHLQIENINTIKDYAYVSGSDKPNVFSNRLLEARGLLAPELFLDADILEKLADRSEDKLFVKSLTDIKNIIYKNIYNNLIHIYKAKGTEKSFRNLIRCFGIDEEIVKLNLYGNNIEYELRENTTMSETRKRLIDFNNENRFSAVVFQNSSSVNSNSVSYISGSSQLANGYAFTLETEVLFPKKAGAGSNQYSAQNFNSISSSIFGAHTAIDGETDATTWNPLDAANFQVYAVREAAGDDEARFVLTGSTGGYVPLLSSTTFSQVYDNSKWSLAVRVRPDTYPEASFVSGSNLTSHNWVVELYGVQYDADVIVNQFSVSGSLSRAAVSDGFVTGSKRVYVGAHVENFTGSLLKGSDVKVAACRYWLDYVSNDAIKAHARDVKNYGALHPYRNSYLFQNGKNNFEVPQIETLALNWDFEQVTSSNASGEFVVSDFSSGSTLIQSSRYGVLGNIVSAQHTGRGYGFPASTAKVVDVDYLVSAKQNMPENLYAIDMIKVLTTEDDLEFTRESRPITFFFAFEKSMYETISEEMLNIFGSIVDFNNLIGEPVNKYRMQYKRLGKLRQLFFERVANTPDLDKYIEFYKWFDISLGKMIQQLVPASADVADGVRIMVENHILARDKYQHKFPTLEMKATDPEGAIETVQPTSPGWEYTHHPVNNLPPYKANWWLHMASRNKRYIGDAANPLSSSVAAVNNSRSMILRATESVRNRKKTTPYRFSAELAELRKLRTIRSGINYANTKERDIVYRATYPAGPLVPGTNIPANVMLAFGKDVEKPKNIVDDLTPSKKKKYDFGINIGINKKMDYTSMHGSIAAPFSLYSSSVKTGYNLEVVNRFTASVELTNLHTDVYGPDYETPMQGPFTEKFVGGRQHRHIETNKYDSTKTGPNNLDDPENRPEGFKLRLGLWAGGLPIDSMGGESPGALGIVGPQYPDPDSPAVKPPYLYNRPKANLKRGEGAKRPVNIKNILMTTGSLKQNMSGTLVHSRLGNYQKTYQIVQTAGRSINDPFFQDQSFNFALYPETLATRGRFPLVSSSAVNDTWNVSGNLNFALPDRSGANSNQSIIVNRFNAPGGYDVSSRGYMDPAHEEKSVYNALPWRNRNVIDYGRSGSVPGDPTISGTIHVVDQIDKARGLDQLSTLHSGRFGVDAAYGSVPQVSYATVPSWNKMNRNPKRVIKEAPVGAGTFNGAGSTVNIGDDTTWNALIGGSTTGTDIKAFSVSAWVKLDSAIANIGHIFSFGSSDRRAYVSSTGQVNFSIDGATDGYVRSADGALTTDRWYHVMCTYNGIDPAGNVAATEEAMKIYIDGWLSSGTSTIALNDVKGIASYDCHIGSRANPSPLYSLTGSISNVAIWSKELRQDEVGEIYNYGTVVNVLEKDLTNLVAWYRFNTYAGDTTSEIRNQVSPVSYSDIVTGSATAVVLQTTHAPPREELPNAHTTWPTYRTNIYDNAYVTHQIPQSDRQYAWITASLLPNAKVYGYDGLTSYHYLENNYSMYFSGSSTNDDSVDIGGAATWNALIGGSGTSTKAFTISAWVMPSQMSSYAKVWDFGDYDRALYINSGELRFQMDGTQYGRVKTSTNEPHADEWTHVVCTFEGGDPAGKTGGGMKIYLNGVEDTNPEAGKDLNDPDAISAEDCRIGAASGGASGGWRGNIDEVSIWGVAMTDAQVEELYNTGHAKFLPQHSAAGSLLSWYRMGDSPDDTDGDVGYLADVVGGRPGISDGATKSRFSIAGWNYDGPYHYKLENQFISASDLSSFVYPDSGTDYQAWGLPKPPNNKVGATTYPTVVPVDFVGMNTNIREPINSSTNTLGFALETDDALYINVGNEGTVFPAGYFASDSFIQVYWAGAAGGEAAYEGKTLNALMLHRNGPYGWPTFRQIQAGPHSHPLVRDQRKNNRLTIRTDPEYRDNSKPSLKGNSFVSYREPPVGSQHKVMTHTLVTTNRILGLDRQETFIDQTLIYNHSFANKVDYFANIQLNNKLNLKLDTDRGDIYFNRLNELLLASLAGPDASSPFENIDNVVVNYKQRVYPAGRNAGLNRNRRRVIYSIKNIWNDTRTLRVGSQRPCAADEGAGVPTPFSLRDGSPLSVPSASIWPLDGHSNFQGTASADVNSHGGAGLLQNQYSGFGTWGRGTMSASCVYAQRGMYGTAPNGQTSAYQGGTTNPVTVFGGDAEWQAADQAGKQPHITYDRYCQNLRLLGKDYSIVPEFRISEHMDYYLNEKGGNFWADNDGFLDLTGSVVSSSAEPGFYKIYSNSDFMKLFGVVDEAYDEKSLVNGDKMSKNKLSLRCSAYVKFLPYKGFYPAERTEELSRLLSSSYGPFMDCTSVAWSDPTWNNALLGDGYGSMANIGTDGDSTVSASALAFRSFTEPLIGPGLLFNTIKSGIALSNYIIRKDMDAWWNISSAARYNGGFNAYNGIDQDLAAGYYNNRPIDGERHFAEDYGRTGLMRVIPTGSNNDAVKGGTNNYYSSKLPFEALLSPKTHMANGVLQSNINTTLTIGALTVKVNDYQLGYIFDRGVGSGSLSSSYANVPGPSKTGPSGGGAGLVPSFYNKVLWGGAQEDNYELAIDNFVCETVDFFQTDLKNFQSAREDQFAEVKAGSVYAMKIELYRTLKGLPPASYNLATTDATSPVPLNKLNLPDTGPGGFVMYNRPSAFGRAASGSNDTGTGAYPTFVHVTPPYYFGYCDATIIFKPTIGGKPTMEDIFTKSQIVYRRSGEVSDHTYMTNFDNINSDVGIWRDLAQQLSASINLKKQTTTIIPGTATSQKRWLIQTKFETPVLNFADVSASAPVQGVDSGGFSLALGATKGMWHQYGKMATGSAGLFMQLSDTDHALLAGYKQSDPHYKGVQSLKDVCGFTAGRKRIGEIKNAKIVSEAVVAVPFTVARDGRRKFYRFSKNQRNGALRTLDGKPTLVDVKPDVLKICKAQRKYVFPPKFDFVTTETGREIVDPFVMFIFEFEKKFSQQDLADMWQNLPPGITLEEADPKSRGRDNLQAAEITIQHSLLAEDFFDNANRQVNAELRWMIFKVKQRAASNYNKYKVRNLSDDLSTVPNSIDSPYTYNWPYDYFSLAELVKVDMGLQYSSSGSAPALEETDASIEASTQTAAEQTLALLS